MVRVVVNTKERFEEMAFRFTGACSATAFMECLAEASEKELVFTVTFETDKKEEKSRFINPEELEEILGDELMDESEFEELFKGGIGNV